MATSLLAPEIKRTESISLIEPLRLYIRRSYSEDDSQYSDDFRTLEILRNDIVNVEIHTNALSRLLKYYGQLHFISAKFPIDENNIRICFPWYTAFSKEKRPVNQYHLHFEKASVLFNIGALYAQLGAQESRITEEGIKRSCDYMQKAAGVFTHLRDTLNGELRGFSPPVDMSAASLNCIINVLLGQAQECFWLKGCAASMKDNLISKIAAKAAEYYSLAYDSLLNSMASSLPVLQHWATHIKVKNLYFDAACNFRAAADCNNNGKYGEQVGRLKAASASIKKALESQKYVTSALVEDLKALEVNVEKARTAAQKDNDIIYLQAVPAVDALSKVKGADMTKVIPFEIKDFGDIVGSPLFGGLVPLAIHQAASVYTDMRDKLVKEIISGLNEFTTVCHSHLASLNLPGAIEAIEQPMGLPQSVIQRCEEFRGEGGVRAFQDSTETISSLAAKVASIIEEASKTLQAEEAEDNDMRTQFKERWSRTRSDELNKNFKSKLAEYKDTLAKAKSGDQKIKEKLESSFVEYEMLASSPNELMQLIPSATSSNLIISDKDPVYVNLKLSLKEIDQLIRSRGETIAQLKDVAQKDELGPVLMDLASRQVEFKDEDLFRDELKKYDVSKEFAAQQEQMQKQLLDKITALHSEFVKISQSNDLLRQRETALQRLDNAYKKYQELKGNLEEGLKFYTEFEKVAEDLNTAISDFCHARNFEKKDLLKDLTTALAHPSSLSASHSPNRLPMPGANPLPGGFANPIPPALPPRSPSQQPPFNPQMYTPPPPYYSAPNQAPAPMPGQWNPSMGFQFQQPGYSTNPLQPQSQFRPSPPMPGQWNPQMGFSFQGPSSGGNPNQNRQ
ncbi:BRO1-like domain-containing protein [Paraphysoderma sedebokerense]|nr:BRO1-like domain-containing protein [Paraphysoderma sedebokerense]